MIRITEPMEDRRITDEDIEEAKEEFIHELLNEHELKIEFLASQVERLAKIIVQLMMEKDVEEPPQGC